MSDALHSQRSAEPVGAYAHARRVGPLLFLAGLGPRKRGSKSIPGLVLDASGKVVSYDLEAEVRQTFENVRIVLEEAGSAWDKIADVTVFLTDLERDFPLYNRLWAEFFPVGTNSPTRTTVGIDRLPQGGDGPIHFEVKVIATA